MHTYARVGIALILGCLVSFPNGATVQAQTPKGAEKKDTKTAEQGGPVYELRIYTPTAKKFADLEARFRTYTMKLFEKHGMKNIAYWVPTDGKTEKLYYLLEHKSQEAATASWKAFGADPEWQQARKKTEAEGAIIAKVERLYLKKTDYSPALMLDKKGEMPKERVFELRIYTSTPGNLDNLNARFRNHTMKLFEKHGMTNLIYWVPTADQKASGNTLIYLLAHKSEKAAKESFDQFRKDPAWIKAYKESEAKVGGSLTTMGGVRSLFLKATAYSPLR